MPEFQSVTDALTFLDNLGSPTAIAGEMERRRIRARRECSDSCAVAVFLLDTCDLSEWVMEVQGNTVDLRTYGPDGRVVRKYLDLPITVQGFIMSFDFGDFPNLEMEQVNA